MILLTGGNGDFSIYVNVSKKSTTPHILNLIFNIAIKDYFIHSDAEGAERL